MIWINFALFGIVCHFLMVVINNLSFTIFACDNALVYVDRQPSAASGINPLFIGLVATPVVYHGPIMWARLFDSSAEVSQPRHVLRAVESLWVMAWKRIYNVLIDSEEKLRGMCSCKLWCEGKICDAVATIYWEVILAGCFTNIWMLVPQLWTFADHWCSCSAAPGWWDISF